MFSALNQFCLFTCGKSLDIFTVLIHFFVWFIPLFLNVCVHLAPLLLSYHSGKINKTLQPTCWGCEYKCDLPNGTTCTSVSQPGSKLTLVLFAGLQAHACVFNPCLQNLKKTTFYINASNFVPHRCPGSVPASQKEVKRTINSSK